MRKMISSLILIFLFTPILLRAQSGDDYKTASEIADYKYIGTFGLDKMDKILGPELDAYMHGSPLPAEEYRGKFEKPKYPVKLYRVRYKSVIPEFGNQPITATGLVAVPETGTKTMPVLSYQHGTVFSKYEVPSHPDSTSEVKLMLATFGAQGYIVVGADYFGLGESDLPNSYLVKEASEQACLDMLIAAGDVLVDLGIERGDLFLHGWSQGGWTTMSFLRKLEELNITVKAAAVASAPVDAFGTINRWLNNWQPGDAIYLPGCGSNFFFSHEYYNNLPDLAKRAIKPEYYQVAKDFYEFKIDFKELVSKTPVKTPDMFNDEFRVTGDIGTEPFWKMLEEMQAYRWRIKTPLRTYYGEADEVVPVYIALLPENWHKLLGSGDTKAVNAGPKADHRGTYIYSSLHPPKWFSTFK
ncbi:MAG: hypothetical protein HBSAPP04_06520 [Ignavibacteriaceae bacterium]|nr:MAG: hypothetical protein EDM75_02195 [Chlorobiota bacterium]GJQ31813.1 MAG: hypothetical protein HBSAPP04_06520 [Ignavibacteriaceae bacterium]